jgi:signal transduction histidine kinase
LQYRWIGEVSLAERETMRASLDHDLKELGQTFDAELAAACSALLPPRGESNESGSLLAERYRIWKRSTAHPRLFQRVSYVRSHGGKLDTEELDQSTGEFRRSDWPAAWSRVHEYLLSPQAPDGARTVEELTLALLPFAGAPSHAFAGGPSHASEWLILELNTAYLRSEMLPELLKAHLGHGAASEWDVEVVGRGDPSLMIFREAKSSATIIGANADGSVGLFSVPRGLFSPPRTERHRRAEGGVVQHDILQRGDEALIPRPDWGRWLLRVRHRGGSLQAVVDQNRRRNLTVTGAVLVLLLASALALFLYTRRAQRLASLQVEFVASVSHELRTPLSVIRTAAHNLAEGVVRDADQMRSYGVLIEEEAGRLTGMVEEVLQFASMESGQAAHACELLQVGALIDRALASSSEALGQAQLTVERNVAEPLPRILGDAGALQHALQNLVGNAAKHGGDGGWLGISAELLKAREGLKIEVRVKDRGRGIPSSDLRKVFEPFFRGRRAIAEQIHGTGLGLCIVKRTVEAHGGSVDATSEPGYGAEFVMRLPVAPGEA